MPFVTAAAWLDGDITLDTFRDEGYARIYRSGYLERVHVSTQVLTALKAVVTERVYPGMGHTINHDEIAQVRRQQYANHDIVCTSTDNTPGRSRAIAVHESPASADAYTCPPVVPKYTPHLSNVSTAMASRSTFT